MVCARKVQARLTHARHYQDTGTVDSAGFELIDDFRPGGRRGLAVYLEALDTVDVEYLAIE
jgi:hypothetical protein